MTIVRYSGISSLYLEKRHVGTCRRAFPLAWAWVKVPVGPPSLVPASTPTLVQTRILGERMLGGA